MSVIRAQKLVKKGYTAFVAHLWEGNFVISPIDSFSTVWEFLEVFPDNLPSMPPDHEVDFYIDLEPRTHHISIPPRHVALEELRELKSQL